MQRNLDTPFLNKRNPRVDRDEHVEIQEDENSHLWAVAYSDLLMVLLSFFILFFSMDNSEKDSLLNQLTRTISSQTVPFAKLKEEDVSKAVFVHLSDMNFKIIKEKQSLVVHFSDQLFKTNEFKIDSNNQTEILNVLNELIQYKDQIEIFFEGHADHQQIKQGSKKLIDNNFTLSSLRAINALQLAKEKGFHEKQLFAQGSSSNNRDSRSLSIRIQTRPLKNENQEMDIL